nr:extracellular serine proteinase [Tanacetum cinerariifolium]
MRVASARDFDDQSVAFESLGDAETLVFPEIGVALLGAAAAQERSLSATAEIASDSPVASIDAEHFMFADQLQTDYMRGLGQGAELGIPDHQHDFSHSADTPTGEYLRGFLRAAELIAKDLGNGNGHSRAELELQEDILALGATWGLTACRVPQSLRSAVGIRVAILDTGMDLGHPDFAGRPIVGATFVGQPVQDMNGHGTHTTGTANGPKSPAGSTPRYG